MKVLHLSKSIYFRRWGEMFDTMDAMVADNPEPLCGVEDGNAVIPRGQGTGLLPHAAINPEYHCRECARIALGESK